MLPNVVLRHRLVVQHMLRPMDIRRAEHHLLCVAPSLSAIAKEACEVRILPHPFFASCTRSSWTQCTSDCLPGGIAAELSLPFLKMVELLLEDGQIAAGVSDDITATVANLRRTSSCGFRLCCRAIRKLSLSIGPSTGLPEGTSGATQKAVGVSASVVLAGLRMMLEAAVCSLAAMRKGKRHLELVPPWHGPEDSEAASPSQQLGQLGPCKKAVAPANLG